MAWDNIVIICSRHATVRHTNTMAGVARPAHQHYLSGLHKI